MTTVARPTTAPPVRVAAMTDRPLEVGRLADAVSDPRAGGTALFVGSVRDHDHGRSVTALTYEAHPTADAELRRVAQEVASLPDVIAVAAEHRVGPLQIGDLAVVVAVSCAHRGDAFHAGRVLIDRIKAEVPIWKHQLFADGSSEWVACTDETPEAMPCPDAAGRTLGP